MDETSVDLASLRRELERIEREKAENRVTQQQLPTEGSGNGYPLAQQVKYFASIIIRPII